MSDSEKTLLHVALYMYLSVSHKIWIYLGEYYPCYALVFFMRLQATHEVKWYYFWMNRKSRILIVSFLGRIQVTSRRNLKHRRKGSSFCLGFCHILFATLSHFVPFIKIIGNTRIQRGVFEISFAWIERQRSRLQVFLVAPRFYPRKSMEGSQNNFMACALACHLL